MSFHISSVEESWREALEEGERVARTIEYLRKKELEELKLALAEKDSALAKQKLENEGLLAERDARIAEIDSLIEIQKKEHERLLAEYKELCKK